MKFKSFYKRGYSLTVWLFIFFLVISFLLRLGSTVASFQQSELRIEIILTVFAFGALYDFGAGALIILLSKPYPSAARISIVKSSKNLTDIKFPLVVFIIMIFLAAEIFFLTTYLF